MRAHILTCIASKGCNYQNSRYNKVEAKKSKKCYFAEILFAASEEKSGQREYQHNDRGGCDEVVGVVLAGCCAGGGREFADDAGEEEG